MSELERTATGTIILPEGGARENVEYKQRSIFKAVPTVSHKILPKGDWLVTWKNGPNEVCTLEGKLDEGSKPTPKGDGMTSNGFSVKVIFFNEK